MSDEQMKQLLMERYALSEGEAAERVRIWRNVFQHVTVHKLNARLLNDLAFMAKHYPRK